MIKSSKLVIARIISVHKKNFVFDLNLCENKDARNLALRTIPSGFADEEEKVIYFSRVKSNLILAIIITSD